MTQIEPDGYLALPKNGQGSGILVLHAWWGLNGFFQDLCKRLAREGFTAFALDLYHGRVAATIKEAESLRSKLSRKQAQADIAVAIEYLRGLDAVNHPSLCHFAETDEWEAPSSVKKLDKALRAANRPATFHTYAGTGHWFFEKDRADAYNSKAARLAWQRTVTFLRETLTL